MNKPKTRAAMWVASCALYMLCGEVLRQWDIQLGASFALLIGMYCATECFSCGRGYERKCLGFELEESKTPGRRKVRRNVCGCEDFTIAAGRMICACCGAVADLEPEEKDHGTEG